MLNLCNNILILITSTAGQRPENNEVPQQQQRRFPDRSQSYNTRYDPGAVFRNPQQSPRNPADVGFNQQSLRNPSDKGKSNI